MSNTPNFNRWEDNAQLEADMKPLCKEYVIRFAKEVLGWTEPVKFRWATLEENKNGVDCWISRDGKSAVGIDLKIRREGTFRYFKEEMDLLIEFKQATTYGWATQPDHNPRTIVLFVFLDGLKDDRFPSAVAITLSSCTKLANEGEARGFKVRKASNGYGWASNYQVPLSSIDPKNYRVMYN